MNEKRNDDSNRFRQSVQGSNRSYHRLLYSDWVHMLVKLRTKRVVRASATVPVVGQRYPSSTSATSAVDLTGNCFGRRFIDELLELSFSHLDALIGSASKKAI